jgi:hypothetical protein
MRAFLVAFLLVSTNTAHADVDWARGLVTAKAVGTADRRAPSPAIARPGALREAEKRAQASLLEQARRLPMPDGTTVGDRADQDPAAADALGDACAASIEVDTEYLPDGSVRVERALAIESVRQALTAPELVSGVTPKDAPTALVVDARKLKIEPSVGISVIGDGGKAVLSLPALWLASPKEVDLGAHPIKKTATKVDNGFLVVDDLPDAAAGMMLVVLVREKK